MENLATHFALNGVIVIIVSLFGGLFLYRAILKNRKEADWHLLHAGGSVRGVMLIQPMARLFMHITMTPLHPACSGATRRCTRSSVSGSDATPNAGDGAQNVCRSVKWVLRKTGYAALFTCFAANR